MDLLSVIQRSLSVISASKLGYAGMPLGQTPAWVQSLAAMRQHRHASDTLVRKRIVTQILGKSIG